MDASSLVTWTVPAAQVGVIFGRVKRVVGTPAGSDAALLRARPVDCRNEGRRRWLRACRKAGQALSGGVAGATVAIHARNNVVARDRFVVSGGCAARCERGGERPRREVACCHIDNNNPCEARKRP